MITLVNKYCKKRPYPTKIWKLDPADPTIFSKPDPVAFQKPDPTRKPESGYATSLFTARLEINNVCRLGNPCCVGN